MVSNGTAQASRERIMSLPGTGNEKASKKEGGGRSFMGILRFKKRRKSTSAKLQNSTPMHQTGLRDKVSCHGLVDFISCSE